MQSNKVYPGENVSIRLEGEGLHKGDFRFRGADFTITDSLVRNEKFTFYDLSVPVNEGYVKES